MPVRVLDANGSGTDTAVAAGIRFAAQHGANIINLSLGGGFSSTIYAALQYAQSLNVLVVAAAGNEAAPTPSNPADASATLSNVISVGAYDSSNRLAYFSNHVGNSGAVQVDSPGVNIYSTYAGNRYAYLSGTSMATPAVTGLAALALSANHALTASQLRSVIVNGADHLISGSDSRGGIDAALTVALARAGVTSASALSSSSTQSATSGQAASLRRFSLSSTTSRDNAPMVYENGPAFALSTPAASSRVTRVSAAGPQITATAVDRAMLFLGEPAAINAVAQWGELGQIESSDHTRDEVFSSQDDWNSNTWHSLRPALALT
jgi:subtilisin family serine protease